MATSITIREPTAGFAGYSSASSSARRSAGLAARSGGVQFAKLALVAANSGIWLYVTAALGLAA